MATGEVEHVAGSWEGARSRQGVFKKDPAAEHVILSQVEGSCGTNGDRKT